jgi:hypothetical protein
MDWIDLAQDRDQFEDSAENDNDSLGSINFWEFIE